MKQHKSRDEVMDQKKGQVVLFKPLKHKDRGVMRPGKTKKDKERLHKKRDIPA